MEIKKQITLTRKDIFEIIERKYNIKIDQTNSSLSPKGVNALLIE